MQTKAPHNLYIVGIRDGKFTLAGYQVGDPNPAFNKEAALDAEALGALFAEAGYRGSERIMSSSSLNHPEDAGAPAGFLAHHTVQLALAAALRLRRKQLRNRSQLSE